VCGRALDRVHLFLLFCLFGTLEFGDLCFVLWLSRVFSEIVWVRVSRGVNWITLLEGGWRVRFLCV